MYDFLCKDKLRLGFILRVVVTVIILYSLKFFSHKKEDLLLLIVVKLILLDTIESLPTLFYRQQNETCWNPCTHLNYYQIPDKILDLFSYLLVYVLLDYDEYLFILIAFRFFGVYLFANTQKREWLIPFFDFVKEYLVYLYFFGYNFQYIWVFFLCKIGLESYHHYYFLLHNRCLKRPIRS